MSYTTFLAATPFSMSFLVIFTSSPFPFLKWYNFWMAFVLISIRADTHQARPFYSFFKDLFSYLFYLFIFKVNYTL